MKSIVLNRRDVPQFLRLVFPDYWGRKWKVTITDEVRMRHGHWCGGSKSYWRLLKNQRTYEAGQFGSLEGKPSEIPIKLEDDMFILEHRIFQGHDLGIRIYCNEGSVVRMLPCKVELSDDERVVLKCTKSYKSAYRREYAQQEGISATRYDEIVDQLKARKLLAKNGAITVEGRNALS